MATSLIKTANFGRNKTGRASLTGYRLIDDTGVAVRERTQAGVYETYPGTGIYAADIEFEDGFKGTILWDIEGDNPVFAAEEFNDIVNGGAVKQQVTEVTTQIGIVSDQVTDLADEVRFIRGMTAGRWSVNKKDSTMTFYDESGTNILVKYALFDENGKPSIESVFDRKIINSIDMIENIVSMQTALMALNMTGSL